MSATTSLRPEEGARLGVARGTAPHRDRLEGAVGWLVVERGAGTLRVGDLRADVSGREDVFSSAGWSAVIPPGVEYEVDGDVEFTLVWRPTDRAVEARIINPDEVPDEERGSGANARRVRTYLPDGPIIAGETLNPPGGWSSYPPHRHEHEEVYLYRFSPGGGFGVAIEYDDDREEATVVHDGHVQRISSGYHPVVAAPGYAMYYLWALAGESDTLTPSFDPRHAESA